MQAFSRTNRIYDATKTFGNIVTFRDRSVRPLMPSHYLATKHQECGAGKSYEEYMQGFTDAATGEAKRGFMAVVSELEQRFLTLPVSTVKREKAFVKLFGEYLRAENILQNYDEFATLKALQKVDISDPEAVETFKAEHYVDDEKFAELQTIRLPAERKVQDYRSAYNDIRDWQRREKAANDRDKSTTDWDDVVFEIDLLKSQEINPDYILGLIFDHNRQKKVKKP